MTNITKATRSNLQTFDSNMAANRKYAIISSNTFDISYELCQS